MKRCRVIFAAVGLLMLLALAAGPSGAARPAEAAAARPAAGSAVELQPAPAAAHSGYRNPFLPIVDFLLDDGAMEYQFGVNTQGHGLVLLGLNRFTFNAGEYPLLLTQISVLFPDAAHANIDLTGRNVDLLVYRDTSGSGQPANATKIYQSTVQVQTLSPNFSVYPVNLLLSGPGDVYIGFANTYDHGGGVIYSYPFGIDQSQSQRRSWIIGNFNGGDPDYNDLANNQVVSVLDDMGMSYIGSLLIRGHGEVGATPNPTPTRTRTPTPSPIVTRPPAYVLYDQYNQISPIYATNSQQYEPSMQPYTDYLADDFVVPAGETWTLDEVDVAGRIDGGMGPVASFNVTVYTSGGTVPGTPLYTATNLAYTVLGGGEYHISLTTPAVLPAGTYWLMVQGNLAYWSAGQFMWYNRAARAYNAAAWYNPGDGWGTTCTELWGTRWQCTGDLPEPDQVYRLLGTSSGGPTATPTATPTCAYAVTGQLTYQGLLQPDPANAQPLTLQLWPMAGGAATTYSTTTDLNGIFVVPLGALPPGSYNYWLKSPRYLAVGGTLTLTAPCGVTKTFGQQPAGDIDNTNCVDVSDFALLRATFGKACGDAGYDGRADYTGDCLVDISDFALLRANFGTCGASPPPGPSVRSKP